MDDSYETEIEFDDDFVVHGGTALVPVGGDIPTE